MASLVRLRYGSLGFALVVLLSPQLAHAAEPVPDPVATATVSLDALWNLVAVYGWTWGAMAVVFSVLRDVLRRNESTHWIAQGRALAVLTATVGIGITAIQAHFQGAPWAGVVITGILAAFKLIDPNTVTAPPVAPAAARDVGTEAYPGTIGRSTLRTPPLRAVAVGSVITILIGLLVGVGLPGMAACGARQRVASGVGAFLDCEAANLPPDTLADATALASSELRHLISGSGVVDVALKADMTPLKTDLLRCAFTGAIAALEEPTAPAAPAAPGTPSRDAFLVAKAGLARDAFLVAKAELGWGTVKPIGGGMM
jgi:hypothetical protein